MHVNFRPTHELTDAIKWYQQTTNLRNITIHLRILPGYDNLNIDWVRGDPAIFARKCIALIGGNVRWLDGGWGGGR